jgi:hypothetical protein
MMADVAVLEFRKYCRHKLASLKSETHVTKNNTHKQLLWYSKYIKYSVTLISLPDAHRLKLGGGKL